MEWNPYVPPTIDTLIAAKHIGISAYRASIQARCALEEQIYDANAEDKRTEHVVGGVIGLGSLFNLFETKKWDSQSLRAQMLSDMVYEWIRASPQETKNEEVNERSEERANGVINAFSQQNESGMRWNHPYRAHSPKNTPKSRAFRVSQTLKALAYAFGPKKIVSQ